MESHEYKEAHNPDGTYVRAEKHTENPQETAIFVRNAEETVGEPENKENLMELKENSSFSSAGLVDDNSVGYSTFVRNLTDKTPDASYEDTFGSGKTAEQQGFGFEQRAAGEPNGDIGKQKLIASTPTVAVTVEEMDTSGSPSPQPPASSRVGQEVIRYGTTFFDSPVGPRTPWAAGREIPRTPYHSSAPNNTAVDNQNTTPEFIKTIARGFDELFDENKKLRQDVVDLKVRTAELETSLKSEKAKVVSLEEAMGELKEEMREMREMYRNRATS